MAVFVVVMLMVLVVLVVVGKVEEAKEKVSKSKMTEHSSLEYAKIFVQRQRLILLLIICVQLYVLDLPSKICTLMCPTFTNMYFCHNMPHFPNDPHFYKCIFVPQCAIRYGTCLSISNFTC